ncbi:MAG: MarR family transcriptional regulator [Gammaproteobacteria bacterium]|nr:MarR family transcriptional regulator [Gammaproteobacteria bacterium]
MTEALLPYAINIAEWRVIFCLHDGRTCTLNELVNMTGLKQSSLSRLAVRAEKKGLVTRARRPSDARLVDIRITARGRRLYYATTAAVQAACEKALAILTKQERKNFVSSAQKLLASLPPPIHPSGFQY